MNLPKMLVVDDNPEIGELISVAFSGQYEVVVELSGTAGLERALEIAPQVLICDLIMPGTDGLSVCERMKAERPDTIVVIVTAATHGSDLPDAFWRLGTPADGFITKPFELPELMTMVRDLKKQRAQSRCDVDPLPPGAPPSSRDEHSQ